MGIVQPELVPNYVNCAALVVCVVQPELVPKYINCAALVVFVVPPEPAPKLFPCRIYGVGESFLNFKSLKAESFILNLNFFSINKVIFIFTLKRSDNPR